MAKKKASKPVLDVAEPEKDPIDHIEVEEVETYPQYWCVAIMQGVPGFNKGSRYPVIDIDKDEAIVVQNDILVPIPIKKFNIMFKEAK